MTVATTATSETAAATLPHVWTSSFESQALFASSSFESALHAVSTPELHAAVKSAIFAASSTTAETPFAAAPHSCESRRANHVAFADSSAEPIEATSTMSLTALAAEAHAGKSSLLSHFCLAMSSEESSEHAVVSPDSHAAVRSAIWVASATTALRTTAALPLRLSRESNKKKDT